MATTIFIATGAIGTCVTRSKSADAIEQPLEEMDVAGRVDGMTVVDAHRAREREIAHQHANDANGQEQASRQLGE